jgi:uncharacterized protein YndB with AHSA1/START domain
MTGPVATAGIMIRRPVAEVFQAFVDPVVTTRFWFTDSSGPLERGTIVRWTWAMYGASDEVVVKAVEPDRRILIVWDAEAPTEVEWTFEARGDDTWVMVENRGFTDDEAGVAKAIDSTGGFALVLAGAKIWLERGLDPRFVEDRHPDHHVEGWVRR